jgi:O-antigen/teichoic acid export membrane protein
LIFFLSTVISTATWRSGDALIRLITGDYAQVGYYGVAYKVLMTGLLFFPQFVTAFLPLQVSLFEEGRTAEIAQWVERLLKNLTILGAMILFGALFLSRDVVPLVFGPSYRPVADNLMVLMVALLLIPLISCGHLIAAVFERPWIVLRASLAWLLVFWGLAWPLTRWQQSLGACVAMLVGFTVFALYIALQSRRLIRYSVRGWFLVVATGIPFLPLVLLRGSLARNAGLYALFLAGYIGLLFLSRVVTVGEIAFIWRTLKARGG